MSDVRCLLDARAVVGEGPLWHPREKVLYWIDIKNPHLYRYDPDTGENRAWPMPERIGCHAFCRDHRMLVALKSGFHVFDPESGSLGFLADPEADKPENRFNDGRVDRRGRLFAGTMDDAEEAFTGSLYRLDPDLSIRRIRENLGISNGIGWSPDDRTMYFADSMRRVIWAYDYEIGSGTPSNEREFVRLPETDGFPDGLCVDAEGCVWFAVWGGWRIERRAPDGRLMQIVELPVPQPSSCAFGGPSLSTLFVTSARIGIPPEMLEKAPLSGGLFAVEVAATGQPEESFAGPLPPIR